MDDIKANSSTFIKLGIIGIVKNKQKCLIFIESTQFRK